MLDLASQFLVAVVYGLLYGAMYALAALGFSLIFSVLGVLNLAHGDFIMMGGFFGFLIGGLISFSTLGFFGLVILLASGFVLLAVIGAAYELAFVKFILKRSSVDILISSILVTVGTALIIEDVGDHFFTQFTPSKLAYFSINAPINLFTIRYGSLYLNAVEVVALLTLVVATVGLYVFSRTTYLGRAMRAITQNRESTLLMGVNVQRVSLLTFAIGSGFGGLTGVAIGMTSVYGPLTPDFGLPYTISLLAVIVLGGTKSYWGPLVGGIMIGEIQEFVQVPVISSLRVPVLNVPFNGDYWYPVVSIFVLIIVLMVKPTGLSGRR
jgi:branched-subunit amino acid ABC-type transport system permease component